ncbi:hypothetical protein MP228_011717 [Amoeboaphelidium protococcarum]|nr:hypothetical protein MP228_011717 [Amoeboaphelidium protococcarum]
MQKNQSVPQSNQQASSHRTPVRSQQNNDYKSTVRKNLLSKYKSIQSDKKIQILQQRRQLNAVDQNSTDDDDDDDDDDDLTLYHKFQQEWKRICVDNQWTIDDQQDLIDEEQFLAELNQEMADDYLKQLNSVCPQCQYEDLGTKQECSTCGYYVQLHNNN